MCATLYIGLSRPAQSYINLQRETEEKARQPETKLGAIAQTRHAARLCKAVNPKYSAAGQTPMRSLARPLAEVV
jgi:hypothetical protein